MPVIDTSSLFILCFVSGLNDVLVADALVLQHAADGLCKHIGHAELLHLGALVVVGNGVGEDNFLQGAFLYAIAGWPAHHTMGGTGTYTLGTCSLHYISSHRNGASCINHIVNHNHVLVLHITYNLHAGNHVGACTGLVAQHERTSQVFCIGICTLGAAHIRRGNDKVIKKNP